MEVRAPHEVPGDPFDRFSILLHRDALITSGALTEPEVEETIRYLEDPSKHVLTPVLFAAWGWKPTS